MNTKEAIYFVNTIPSNGLIFDPLPLEKRKKQLINLLKRGEKFEAIVSDWWEGLEFMPNKDLLHMNYEDFVNHMKKIEQKYFPKGGQSCKLPK